MEEVEVVEVLEGGEGEGEAICANLNTSPELWVGRGINLKCFKSTQLHRTHHFMTQAEASDGR